ncbi:MAG: chemotaxis protein CheW [Aggregatilineales bacterium]
MTTTQSKTLPILTFTIGEQYYGLPIERVVEVATMVALIRTPSSNPAVIGIVNRHGSVLPMLDLRRIFADESSVITDATLFIVGQFEDQQVGLLVDSIEQVEYVAKTQMRLSAAAGKYIHGIISYNNMLIQLITLEPLIEDYLPNEALDDDLLKVDE